MAFRAFRPSGAAVVYVGGLTALAAVVIDEKLGIRQWTRRSHRIPVRDVDLRVHIRSRVRASDGEAGQGCVDWPAGRVLLQWAVDGGVPPDDARVLEIGSGVGLTAIGLHASHRCRVLATDICDAALAAARENAVSNGVGDESTGLTFAKWNASGGHAAVQQLPLAPTALTHVLGADLVSGPVFEQPTHELEPQHANRSESETSGLEATLAALLEANPDLNITLCLTNRCAGGGVSALAAAAGVEHVGGVTYDPALVRFERRCEQLGLSVQRRPVPDAIVSRVSAAQPLLERAQWWLADTWDGLVLYSVTVAPR